MSITTLKPGDEVASGVLNDNFSSLQTDISKNADDITDITKTNGTIDTKVNAAKSTLETSINTVDGKFVLQPSVDYINGLVISKSSSDTIAVLSGSCYDSTKEKIIKLNSNTTKTNINAQNTEYNVYIIDGEDVTVDIFITTTEVSDSSSLPNGYSLYRKIGKYATDSDSNISSVTVFGVDKNAGKPQVYIIDSGTKTVSALLNPTTQGSITTGTTIDITANYNLYSNGYCEQWGDFGNAFTGYTKVQIRLLKSYSDKKYSVCVAPSHSTYCSSALTDKNVGDFTYSLINANGYASWETKGYISL